MARSRDLDPHGEISSALLEARRGLRKVEADLAQAARTAEALSAGADGAQNGEGPAVPKPIEVARLAVGQALELERRAALIREALEARLPEKAAKAERKLRNTKHNHVAPPR